MEIVYTTQLDPTTGLATLLDAFRFISFMLAFIGALVLLLYVIVTPWHQVLDDHPKPLIGIVVTLACFSLALFCNDKYHQQPRLNKYEVMVTDMNKIDRDKYVIIGERGKLIIIRDREVKTK